MISPRQNENPDPARSSDAVRDAEGTLRLIATLPAPEGLVNRVQARLSNAPRRSSLMGWNGFGMNGWMYSAILGQGLRGCAAAAIVVLVAGGGWRIYSHVQPAPTAKNLVMPARIGPNGGFSSAGGFRTPDTLNGPVLTHPAVPQEQQVIAPMPSQKPQAIAPKAKALAHQKRTASR